MTRDTHKTAIALLLVVAAAALAGCLGEESAPEVDHQETEEQEETLDLGRLGNGTGNGTSDQTFGDPNATRTIHIQARDLEYRDAHVQYRIKANTSTTINATIINEVHGYSSLNDGCDSISLVQRRNGTILGGVAVVGWYYENGYRARVSAAGNTQETQPFAQEYPGAPITTQLMRTDFALDRGDEIVLSIGGRDVEDLRRMGTLTNATLDVRGTVTVERIEDAPLRCGVGPAQTGDETVGVKAPLMSPFQVGGGLSLMPSSASTLIVLPAALGAEEIEARFGAQRYSGEEVQRSLADPVEMGIGYAYGAKPLSGTAWFMADIHWPFVEP